MGNDVEAIRWSGCGLSALGGLLDVYVIVQAWKLGNNGDIYHSIAMNLMICIAVTDVIHSAIWSAELALSDGTIDDGWCTALGFFLHYTSILGLFWHFLLCLLPLRKLKEDSLKQITQCMQKCIDKLSPCVTLTMALIIISIVLSGVGIMISIFLEHNTFGHRCLYEHDDTCCINECWIKEGYDVFWFAIGSLVGICSFGVAIWLCKHIHVGDITDSSTGKYLFQSLLPWLLKFALFRLVNICMRVGLKLSSHHRFSFTGVCVLIITVSFYGLATCFAWLYADHVLSKDSYEFIELTSTNNET